MNATHDPERRSWVASANAPAADFPIQNLPFGVFRPRGDRAAGHLGVAIGDRILDLARCHELKLLSGPPAQACRESSLNGLMALGARHWAALRAALSELLSAGHPRREETARALVTSAQAELLLPAEIGDYTDFYCSIHHATRVGRLFRPENPLLPNYKYLPVGYHGRASSIVASGTPIRRPRGQRRALGEAGPRYGPSELLDYELEVGFFAGPGNALGTTLSVDEAAEQIFGFCLVNDWSARDLQAWEYQPLGPFLSKSFATSVSPWVVTSEALRPFRVPAAERPPDDPEPLPHLDSEANRSHGGLDLRLEVRLRTPRMRRENIEAHRLSHGNFREMYWTAAQMLAHQASGGCNLKPGDLLASGTVSGSGEESRGCLLELTRRGADPLALPSGETRTFLADGDEVILRGFCERAGTARIGFGECRGIVMPAEGIGPGTQTPGL